MEICRSKTRLRHYPEEIYKTITMHSKQNQNQTGRNVTISSELTPFHQSTIDIIKTVDNVRKAIEINRIFSNHGKLSTR